MTKTERDRDLTRRCIVEKWALLVAQPDLSHPECPLCVEYRSGSTRNTASCGACPIQEKTGTSECHGTPLYTGSGAKRNRDLTDWLWALYDELTEKMLAERDKLFPGYQRTCVFCGTLGAKYMDDDAFVCVACRRKLYGADGHYLVPVVRGGPWQYGGAYWELRRLEGYCDPERHGFNIIDGEWHYKNSDLTPRPAEIALRDKLFAPKDYTGPLPEGCRWAEGTEPKPHRILEASFDGKVWCEVSRTYSEGEVLFTDPGKFHSVRIRHVGADGKTQKTIVTRQVSEEETNKPRPKADTLDALGQVAELTERVRILAQLFEGYLEGCFDMRALKALIDRLDGDKGEWRGGIAWE